MVGGGGAGVSLSAPDGCGIYTVHDGRGRWTDGQVLDIAARGTLSFAAFIVRAYMISRSTSYFLYAPYLLCCNHNTSTLQDVFNRYQLQYNIIHVYLHRDTGHSRKQARSPQYKDPPRVETFAHQISSLQIPSSTRPPVKIQKLKITFIRRTPP